MLHAKTNLSAKRRADRDRLSFSSDIMGWLADVDGKDSE